MFKEAKRYLDEGIGDCNTLLVYMKDRIARNYQDYINTLWGIKSSGNYIMSIEGNPNDDPVCVTHNDDEDHRGPYDGLMEILQDTFDAYAYQAYLDSLSKRSVARNERRILEKGGNYLSGFPHFGYKLVKNPDGTRHYEIVEEEAKIVKLMFDLFVNKGWGLTRISSYLNDNGYKYRKNTNKTEYHERFSKDTVRSTLHFEGYATGEAKFFQTENLLRRKPIQNLLHERFDKKYKRIADIPQDELEEFLEKNISTPRDYVVKDVFPIIIDKETYDRYVEIRDGRGCAVKTSLDPNNSGWLCGIAYCRCGAKLYGSGTRIVHHTRTKPDGTTSEDTYYNVYKCSRNQMAKNTISRYGEKCPITPGTYTYRVDYIVLEFLKSIIAGGELRRYIAAGWQRAEREHADAESDIDYRINNLKDDYSKLMKEQHALSLDFASGSYNNPAGLGLPTVDDYNKKREDIGKRMKVIQDSLVSLTKQKEAQSQELHDIDYFEKNFDEMVEKNPAEVIKAFVKKVVLLHKGDFIIWVYLKGLNDAYNPIILKWDGKRKNNTQYEAYINDALQQDVLDK